MAPRLVGCILLQEAVSSWVQTYNPNSIVIALDSYEGPNPILAGPTDDMDLEASVFEPGKLPREFVLVSQLRVLLVF